MSPLIQIGSLVLLVALSWFLRGPKPVDKNKEDIRGYLDQFLRIWTYLLGMYGGLWLLRDYLGPQQAVFGLSVDTQTLEHAAKVVVCSVTNILLAKAIIHLGSPIQKYRTWIPKADSERPEKTLNFCISLSAVVSGLLLVPLILGVVESTQLYLTAVYVPQLLISTYLLIYLTYLRTKLGGGLWTGFFFGCYALCHLCYPGFTFWGWNGQSLFLWVLIGSRLGVGLTNLTARNAMVRNLGRPKEAIDFELAMEFYEYRYSAIDRSGRNVLLGYVVSLLFLLTWTIGTWIYSDDYAGSGWIGTRPATAYLIVLFLVAARGVAYFSFFKKARKVKWEHFNEKEKGRSFRVKSNGTTGPDRWKCEVFKRPENEEPFGSIDVILLHGLYGKMRSTWGLLPWLLLTSDKVARVYTLQYGHHFFSRPKTLKAMPKDFLSEVTNIRRRRQRDFVVIGHSLGGVIALQAAHRMIDPGQAESRQIAIVRKHWRKLICLGSPIAGSTLWWLGIPAAWPFFLRPGSAFIDATLRALRELNTEFYRNRNGAPEPVLYEGNRDYLISSPRKGEAGVRVEAVSGLHFAYSAVYSRRSAQFTQLEEHCDVLSLPASRLNRLAIYLNSLDSGSPSMLVSLDENQAMLGIKRRYSYSGDGQGRPQIKLELSDQGHASDAEVDEFVVNLEIWLGEPRVAPLEKFAMSDRCDVFAVREGDYCLLFLAQRGSASGQIEARAEG